MPVERRARLFVAAALCLLLAACGFQLRQSADLPPALQQLQLTGGGLTPEFERLLVPVLRRAGATLVADAAAATARLEIVAVDEGRDLLALGVGSTVQDFLLSVRIDYRLHQGAAATSGSVTAQRVIQSSAVAATAVLAEARRTQNELRHEAIDALLRRLTAQPAPTKRPDA